MDPSKRQSRLLQFWMWSYTLSALFWVAGSAALCTAIVMQLHTIRQQRNTINALDSICTAQARQNGALHAEIDTMWRLWPARMETLWGPCRDKPAADGPSGVKPKPSWHPGCSPPHGPKPETIYLEP